MCRVLLLFTLVCVLGVIVCVRADLQREFGVKLCGREFIRAVIFTCGGSRWRRTDTVRLPVRVSPGPNSEDARLLAPLSDLLRVSGDGGVGGAQGGVSAWLAATFFSTASGPASSGVQWQRRRRSFSRGLAGMCCSLGCTKSDIGRLC